MAYSRDFRRLVLGFVAKGGSKAEAARRFGVCYSRVLVWLKQGQDHRPGKPGPRQSRKYDQEGLRAEVLARPDALLRELAASRGVSINSISVALKRMGLTRKKTARYAESLRNPKRAQHFLKRLYGLGQAHHRPVYVDEAGFAPTTYRPHARAPKGQPAIGYRAAAVRRRSNSPIRVQSILTSAMKGGLSMLFGICSGATIVMKMKPFLMRNRRISLWKPARVMKIISMATLQLI